MNKVLIVEDDEGIADFLRFELEHEGYGVLHAADGRTALELFENDTPDILLLDIMLPQLNGLEVLRRIRKTSSVPVIMLTAGLIPVQTIILQSLLKSKSCLRVCVRLYGGTR